MTPMESGLASEDRRNFLKLVASGGFTQAVPDSQVHALNLDWFNSLPNGRPHRRAQDRAETTGPGAALRLAA